MKNVEFSDKDNSLPTTNPRRLGRAVDLNEIKTVVNENANQMGFKAIAWEPPALEGDAEFPDESGTGSGGVIQDGNRFRLSAGGYLPTGEGGAAEFWAQGTIVEAFEDNPGQDPTKWRAY
jgi:hypothetical protein